MRRAWLPLSAAAFLLTACAGAPPDQRMAVPDVEQVRAADAQIEDVNLAALQAVHVGASVTDVVAMAAQTGEGSRYDALRDAAYSLGIGGGLYARGTAINVQIERAFPSLSRLFDFTPYMMPGNVFPPVVTETVGIIEQPNTKEIRQTRHTYHVVTGPQLVIEPPTVINYLVRHYPKPELPALMLRPQSDVERKNWRVWVAEGWGIGEKQADLQYRSDLNLLERDLKGVRLFHDLVAKGVLTMPKVTKQDFGRVVSADGRTLNVGDEVITIVQDSRFTDSKQWQPIIEGAARIERAAQ